MNDLISGSLCLFTLVVVLIPVVVLASLYLRAQTGSPPPSAPAQPSPDQGELHVLVTFTADTPWGNRGETVTGRLSEAAHGQRVVLIDIAQLIVFPNRARLFRSRLITRLTHRRQPALNADGSAAATPAHRSPAPPRG